MIRLFQAGSLRDSEIHLHERLRRTNSSLTGCPSPTHIYDALSTGKSGGGMPGRADNAARPRRHLNPPGRLIGRRPRDCARAASISVLDGIRAIDQLKCVTVCSLVDWASHPISCVHRRRVFRVGTGIGGRSCILAELRAALGTAWSLSRSSLRGEYSVFCAALSSRPG